MMQETRDDTSLTDALSVWDNAAVSETGVQPARHDLTSMREIAEEIDRPVDEVQELYEEILNGLREQAQVADYLPIFALRKVRTIYKRNQSRHSG